MKRNLTLCMIVLLGSGSLATARDLLGYAQQAAERPRRVQITTTGGFLGVQLGEVNHATVERLRLKQERGALIEGVTAGSSAAEAGLRKDDVVVKWNGEPVESARELSRRIRETPAGRTFQLGVIRDGREVDVRVKLEERRVISSRPEVYRSAPAATAAVREQSREAAARAREQAKAASSLAREQAREATVRAREQMRVAPGRVHVPSRLGVQVQSMTPQLAEYFGLSNRTGALVVFVYADSPAGKAGLKAGDVILSVGGNKIDDPMELRHVLAEKAEGRVEFKILRDKHERTVTVQLEKDSRSWLLLPGDGETTVRASTSPIVVEVPQIAIAPIKIEVPKIDMAAVTVAVPRIEVPKIDIAPVTIAVPKIELAPLNIQVPKIEIAPVAIPSVKIDLSPMKVDVPAFTMPEIRVVVTPKRIWL